MKIIFLDIDGVLNCQSSKSNYNGLLGIDNDKVKRLRKIVDSTNASIVLCSSWKSVWERFDKDYQRGLGNYLDKELKKENLFIFDKTIDRGNNRGEGIINWLSDKNDIESWVVIDDEFFEDYEEYGIIEHVFKTEFYSDIGGLQEEHVDTIINLLKQEKNL